MSKRLGAIGFLVAVGLLAAACGSGGESEADEEGGKVSGSIFAFGFGYKTGDEIAQIRVDRFRELYPQVNVEFSESGFEEQPFLSALASDDPPDVVNLPRNLIGTYIARGVLQPLDECIEQENIDMGAFYQGALDQVTVDGTPYALPEFLNTRIWMIDNKAFEEAGLNPNTFDFSDWDAITAANKKLTKVEGGKLTRIGIDPKLPEFLPLWAEANGTSMISDDGLQPNFDDPRVVEALNFGTALHEPAGGRTPFLDFRDTWDFFGSENQYVKHQLAAMPIEQWYLTVLAEVSPDVDITVRPFVDREGNPVTWADGNAWAIPADTQNFDAACAFIKTMTEKASWIAAAKERVKQTKKDGLPNTGVYTGNEKADDVIFNKLVDLSDMPAFEEAVNVVLDTQENAVGVPPSPAAAKYEEAWVAAVEKVLEGADPKEELQSAQQRAQDAIDAARR